jgi:hypothetical protein
MPGISSDMPVPRVISHESYRSTNTIISKLGTTYSTYENKIELRLLMPPSVAERFKLRRAYPARLERRRAGVGLIPANSDAPSTCKVGSAYSAYFLKDYIFCIFYCIFCIFLLKYYDMS